MTVNIQLVEILNLWSLWTKARAVGKTVVNFVGKVIFFVNQVVHGFIHSRRALVPIELVFSIGIVHKSTGYGGLGDFIPQLKNNDYSFKTPIHENYSQRNRIPFSLAAMADKSRYPNYRP